VAPEENEMKRDVVTVAFLVFVAAFFRHLLDPRDTSYEAGFATLAQAHIPFVRLMGCGYWTVEQQLYERNREEFFRRFDDVVRAAERHGIGLIPSLFW
jgi:sugar phosphate isomerase/epimerase